MKTATMRRLTILLPVLSLVASASTVSFEYYRRESLKRALARSEQHTAQVAKQLDLGFKRPKDTDEDEKGIK
ncbi:MAG TPA: hypothetical protein VFA07_14620 [Chthonomonadaceae bacterium]|nr:hypothetical protein [Chthonomonadaceae bacterium]